MREDDDALTGPGLALAHLQHFRFDPHGVAVEQRLGKAHLVPAEVGDGGAQHGVADRDAHHQGQREAAIDQALAELGLAAAVLLIEMQVGGVVRHGAEPDVVGFADRAADRVLEELTDMELIVIQTGHAFSLGLCHSL